MPRLAMPSRAPPSPAIIRGYATNSKESLPCLTVPRHATPRQASLSLNYFFRSTNVITGVVRSVGMTSIVSRLRSNAILND